MQTTTRRRCAFCGGHLGQKRSKEHVYSVWLLKALELDDALLESAWLSQTGLVKDVRRHVAAASVLGTVCEDCNTGWMSRLEERIKPIFSKAMDDAAEITLSPVETADIAAWVFKTCAVLNLSSNYRRLFDSGLLRAFGAKRQPPRTIYIDVEYHSNSHDVAERQSQQLTAMVPSGSAEHLSVLRQTFRISLRIGPFTFRLGYSPRNLLLWQQVDTRSVQLWPPSAVSTITLSRREGTPNIDQHDLSLHLTNKYAVPFARSPSGVQTLP